MLFAGLAAFAPETAEAPEIPEVDEVMTSPVRLLCST
jgi:hypothetical protein